MKKSRDLRLQLDQRVENILYDLTLIHGSMTRVVRPRGKYRAEMATTFSSSLQTLQKIVAESKKNGIRLAHGTRTIQSTIEYYEKLGKTWFPKPPSKH